MQSVQQPSLFYHKTKANINKGNRREIAGNMPGLALCCLLWCKCSWSHSGNGGWGYMISRTNEWWAIICRKDQDHILTFAAYRWLSILCKYDMFPFDAISGVASVCWLAVNLFRVLAGVHVKWYLLKHPGRVRLRWSSLYACCVYFRRRPRVVAWNLPRK